MFDPIQQLNAVRRRVGDKEVEAGEARTVTISQTYAATVEEVWDAVTNAERIPRWFLPVSGDLRLGGKYQLEGNAGGTVERCEPPTAFAATWEYGGDVSWIEVRISPEGEGKARFELEHTAVVGPHWNEFGPGAVGIGWDMAVTGLAIYLDSGISQDPHEVAGWLMSPAGKDFVVRSSELWGEADIASGTPAEAARAAAERTTGAYTAYPEES